MIPFLCANRQKIYFLLAIHSTHKCGAIINFLVAYQEGFRKASRHPFLMSSFLRTSLLILNQPSIQSHYSHAQPLFKP